MHRAVLLITLLISLPAASLAALPPGFSDELLHTESFTVGIEILPDGRVLSCLRPGQLLVYTTTGSTAIVDSVAGVTTDAENGFLGVVVHPDWPATPYIYYFYTLWAPTSIIIERRTASGDLSDGTSTNLSFTDTHYLLMVPNSSPAHNGGTLRFGPDGMLYASIGEDNTPCNAQSPELLQGVIVRMDVSGVPAGPGGPVARSSLVPGDNPFASDPTDKALVFAYGFRNPFRFDIDPVTGDLFITDVGQDEYEELNRSTGGENFGWPWKEGYDEIYPALCGGMTGGLTDPLLVHPHTIDNPNALTGGFVYRPPGGAYDFPPLYDGLVFYSEIYSGYLRILQGLNGSWNPLPPVLGQPNSTDWGTGKLLMLDMDVGPDGALYYVKWNGQLRRIKYLGGAVDVPRDPQPTATLKALPNPARSAVRFFFSAQSEAPSVPISIYTVQGQRIRQLKASHPVWDLHTDWGTRVVPGTYYYSARGVPGASGKITVLP